MRSTPDMKALAKLAPKGKAMKVCVLNFSGNVGKSTIAAHLLQPRLNAQVFSVESLNVDASSDGVEVARLQGQALQRVCCSG